MTSTTTSVPSARPVATCSPGVLDWVSTMLTNVILISYYLYLLSNHSLSTLDAKTRASSGPRLLAVASRMGTASPRYHLTAVINTDISPLKRIRLAHAILCTTLWSLRALHANMNEIRGIGES